MLSRLERQSQIKNILLIGNPGVGKSTILNALIGKVVFKSGISNGTGLTTKLQEYCDFSREIRFIDTPGLLDVKSWKQTAEEIRKALQKGGLYKIFFVITLEGGRIRDADQKTMKLVLESVAKIQSCYSVIVNKLEPEVLEMIKENELEMKHLINEGLPGTSSMYWNSLVRELNEKNNVLTTLNREFVNFILNFGPILEIKVEEVNPIRFKIEVEEMMRIQFEIREESRKIEELRRHQIEQEAQIKAEREAQARKQAEYQRILSSQPRYCTPEPRQDSCVLI